MKVLLSHSGKQHAYHVAKALNEMGYLEKFFTSSYISSKPIQDYLIRSKDKFWSRRFLTGVYGSKVESNWRFEIQEILYRKFFGQTANSLHAIYNRDQKFDNYISKKLGNTQGDIFWGFQGSCYESLKSGKRSGKFTICELATAHIESSKTILGEEQKLHPEWADSIDNLIFPKEYERKLRQEPHEAQLVIGASQFTIDTLLKDGISKEKIKLLPLGFEIDHISYNKQLKSKKSRPFRLLYVGKVTQRKGMKYLLEAMKNFKSSDVELHIIGGIQGSGNAFKKYQKNYFHHPPINQYDLFKKYSDYDAFILPSVFEGFGLVIIEALAAGLPVITTSHSMGPEIIINDHNGYIVPIRDINAIIVAIECLLNKSEEEYSQMRINARKTAELLDWNHYATNLKSMLNTLQE